MQWSDIQFSPSDRTLRQFAGLFLIVFGAMAGVEALIRHRQTLGSALAILALVVGSVGLVRPRLIRWLFVGWSVVAFPIGWLVSTVMLAVLFYGVFAPIGILFRATGRDTLTLRRRNVRTYWTPKPAARSAREYFRQS